MTLVRFSISLNSGRSAAAGNDWMRPIAAWISSMTSPMSTPDFNSARTDASPGAARDLTASTSASASSCSSILTTIDSSTSSGVAPG